MNHFFTQSLDYNLSACMSPLAMPSTQAKQIVFIITNEHFLVTLKSKC